MKKLYRIEEAAEIIRVDQGVVIHFIQEEWIKPVEEQWLDEEDLSRALLIQELRENFGVNEEAIPIILNLLDQLYRWELGAKKRSAA